MENKTAPRKKKKKKKNKGKNKEKRASCVQLRTIYYLVNKNE